MNRLDRLSAILIQLQSKKVVRAQEIADRFQISLRTVYRDVHSLEEGGIPIIGEAGVGYSIMDGYRLPPVMFTKEEATAFLMAEKILDKYTDSYNAGIYRSALYKIKAVLRTTEKDFISAIDDTIMVLKNTHQPHSESEETASLQKILAAINEKKVLSITYNTIYSNEKTNRCIEPIGIFLQNSHWYLIAWCRLRNDYRNFKTDRILSQRSTDETFTTQHLSLAGYLERTSKEQQLHTVMISMKKEVAKYVVTEKFYHGFVSEKMMGDNVEMTFLSASLEGFARWYLMFGDNAEILQPMALKKQVAGIIERMQKKL